MYILVDRSRQQQNVNGEGRTQRIKSRLSLNTLGNKLCRCKNLN